MQVEPNAVQYGTLATNFVIMVILLEMRFKVAMLWKDYLKRTKQNGGS